MAFCQITADEARYNDGRFEAAVESLVDSWIATDHHEVAEAALAAVQGFDDDQAQALGLALLHMTQGNRREAAIQEIERIAYVLARKATAMLDDVAADLLEG